MRLVREPKDEPGHVDNESYDQRHQNQHKLPGTLHQARASILKLFRLLLNPFRSCCLTLDQLELPALEFQGFKLPLELELLTLAQLLQGGGNAFRVVVVHEFNVEMCSERSESERMID